MLRSEQIRGAGTMRDCYTVKFVDDLPDGHEWLMAQDGTRTVLFVRSRSVTPEVLEEAWAGFVKLQSRSGVPEQRSAEVRRTTSPWAVTFRRGLLFEARHAILRYA